ncbi:MAG: MATE family efflux transporter, partial [Pyramidobacter sp.]|nr:MATE family efflux transporter [Pyramidobacter sp.]
MEKNAADAQRQFVKMTQSPLRPLIVRLAVPTICSMLITTFYNMADTFFVARIGTSAAGAVGVVFSLMAIIQAIGFMFGMGAGSIASRRLGAQKNDEASEATSSAFFAALALGSLVTVLGLTFLDPFMRLLGSTETILPYAREYARWVLLGAPVMTTSFVMNTNLRAEGKAFFAMVGIVTGGLLNVALDPLFIFVFGMGIAGAAVATVVSQCVSFCILLSHFVFHRSVLRISLR